MLLNKFKKFLIFVEKIQQKEFQIIFKGVLYFTSSFQIWDY